MNAYHNRKNVIPKQELLVETDINENLQKIVPQIVNEQKTSLY